MEERKEQVQEKEIDLRVIVDILIKNLIPLVLVTAIFAAGFYAYSSLFITKKYQASATLIVNNMANDRTTATTTELYAAQSLADVYAIIIKSDTVLQPVIDELKLSMSYEQLRNSINVSTVNSTRVISVSMNHPDAEYAKKVIASVVKVAPDIIKDKVEAGSVKVISEARIANNGKPVSPNVTRNTIIGAAIGFIITLAIVIIREFTNNTFKTEDDIAKTLHIPLLGIIPEVDEKEFNQNV